MKLEGFRTRHQLNPAKTFLLVSRLLPENRADLLIEMMWRLQQECADAKLVIVGDGPDRQRLEKITRDYGIDQSVIFTGAIYDEQELAPWMLSSTALVYPGNMGLSLLHAFGYSLPVITGNRLQGHGPEIHALRDGQNGLFFEDGNVEQLLARCRRVIESPEFTQQLAQSAFETVKTDYTIGRMVDGFARGLESVTGQSQSNVIRRAA